MNPPARIGIDGRWLSIRYPGIGRYVRNLLAALPGEAVDERLVVALAAENEDARCQVSKPRQYGSILIPGGQRRSPGAQLAAWRTVRAARLDLFHATYAPGALGIPGPRVVSVHDLIPLRLPETIADRSYRPLYRLILKRAVSSASRILTPTAAVREQLIERFRVAEHRVVVTPYAADPHFTIPSPAALTSLRRRLGLPERYLLFLGTNKPHKNLRRLLEAWTIAAERGAEGHRLVLAGPVDLGFPAPMEIAATLGAGKVVVVGRVPEDDLPALLGGAQVLLQPSLDEGFGLPVLEAMACGTAVACSAIPALLEVAGDAALSFDPRDVEAMADAIRRLVSDPGLRADLACRGSERARLFSWDQSAQFTMRAYREALGR